jgi:hypothetical protein
MGNVASIPNQSATAVPIKKNGHTYWAAKGVLEFIDII